MKFTLSRKLSVPNVAAYDFSRAVPVGHHENTVQLEATIFVMSGGASSLSVILQGSNDKQNWTTVATWTGLTTGFNTPAAAADVPFAWVRLKHTVVGGGRIVLAANLNTQH